eukprot:m.269264 g.269264  ORF g.269264 m.269264 type:complete len:435 (+) comp26830_c0_seq2:40-1344(+)
MKTTGHWGRAHCMCASVPLLCAAVATGSVAPIVLLPGFPTCGIDFMVPEGATLPPSIPPQCQPPRGSWTSLWPPDPSPVGVQVYCWLQYMGIALNSTSPTGFSPLIPGLLTRVRDFGGFGDMEHLNKTTLPAFENAGYVVGGTLFGAPYDWRLPLSGQPEFIERLQSLVENVSAANGGRKVALVAVSFAPPYALGFLHHMSQQWKDQYISSFVAESPGWSGFLGPILAYITGYLEDGNNATSFATQVTRSLAREVATVPWTFPRHGTDSNTSWTGTEIIFSTEKRNYTAQDYDSLVSDLGGSDTQRAMATAMMADADLFKFSPPGVDTFVACGSGFPTPTKALYQTGFGVDDDWQIKEITMGDGDGVMPSRSCHRGSLWTDNHTYVERIFKGMYHATCTHPNASNSSAPNSQCFRDILQFLNGNSSSVIDIPTL